MKKVLLCSAFVGIWVFISINLAVAQSLGEVGKLYTKSEVENLYGHVVKSVSISSIELTKLANETPDYIMFNILDGHLFILNSSRKVLMGPASSVKPDQVFRLLSTSKVIELLTMGGSDITNIEIREKALTLTNGFAALEESGACPPWCFVGTGISETPVPKEVGKLYSKSEVEKLYGNIVNSVSISSEELTKLANKTPDYIMFNIIDGHLFILNSSRKVLMGPASLVKPELVFKLLSTSKVIELLTMGGSDITNIEIREKALTLTNGITALEQTMPCPPFCPLVNQQYSVIK